MNRQERERHATVLGAAALAITDRAAAAVATVTTPSVTAAAAVSAMRHFLVRPTLDQLRRVLGLTHSGAVRLVDRLCEAGLAERHVGQDGRSREVALTAGGERLADQITAARLTALDRLTAGLTAAEQRTLVELLGRVLANVVDTKNEGAWICRLCDTSACGRSDGLCPTATAATRRFGGEATGLADRS
ncbi:MAG TPA: MarR family transcriptional regulator [Pseudonocardia sp.]